MHPKETQALQPKLISRSRLKQPLPYQITFGFLLQMLTILARLPKQKAFALNGLNSRGNYLFKSSYGIIHSSRRRRRPTTSLSSGDIEEINFEASGFSFEIDSFDKKGQWLTIDWDERPSPLIPIGTPFDTFQPDSDVRINCYSPDEPSPVQLNLINDRMCYIKRDDLLYLHKSNVSGNKARKLIALNQLDLEDFPDAIVSYGGPQSNAMLALAAIVNSKNMELAELEKDIENLSLSSDTTNEIENDDWFQGEDDSDRADDDKQQETLDFEQDEEDLSIDFEQDADFEFGSRLRALPKDRKKRFVYYTKKLPRYLRKQPSGNLLRALSLGMELVQISNNDYNEMFGGEDGGSAFAPEQVDPPIPMKSLWIPQGGCCGIANAGAKLMADEIVSFWANKGNGMPLTVVLPGGTCTTAMLLCRKINSLINKKDGKEGYKNLDIKVAVIPCVGDSAYARRQMKALDESTGGNGRDDIPEIFMPWQSNFPRFGEPSLSLLETFMEMKDTHSLYVDLLYGAPAWNLLLKYLNSQRDSPIKDRQVMYVHSGGLEGVSSQLTRYKHKGFLEDNQVQN